MNMYDRGTPVYLDNNASTPVDPRVVEGMTWALERIYGNPSGRAHSFASEASDRVEEGRERVARLINASPEEIVFASGATESCNLAIKGVAAKCDRKSHFVTGLTEHEAVREPCAVLERQGFRVTLLQPDRYGRVSAEQVEAAITPHTVLVSIMAANNVIGSLNPCEEIGRVVKKSEALFHCDATQAIGKVPVDVDAMNVDLLSMSAHKFYGPKGMGALYVRGGAKSGVLSALIHGGGQEGGLRSGTLNVPGIVGMGIACEVAGDRLSEESLRLKRLRDRLQEALMRRIPGSSLNGHPDHRLPNTLNMTFPDIVATELIPRVPEIAVSVGSACSSETHEPHYVFRAIGVLDEHAAGSVRFSLGRFTTEEEIDYCIKAVASAVERLQTRAAAIERIQGPRARARVRRECPPGCCEHLD
jgi:cysteine desulfurase